MVNISSDNNKINVQVSSATNKNNTPLGVTYNYYDNLAKQWAISDEIVEGKDYSSKHYAQESKKQAVFAENQTKIATQKAQEVVNKGNEALSNIATQENLSKNSVKTEGDTQVTRIKTETKNFATKTEATYTAGSAIDIDNNEVAVKLYDPSKFTIVGSPTITSDGVASGFSENNYVKSTFNLEENKTYTLIIEGIGGEPLTTRGSYLLTVYYKSISAASNTNLRLITTAKTGVMRFALGSNADVTTPFIVTKNKPYKFKIITDFKSFVTVIDLFTGKALTKDEYSINNQMYGKCEIEYGILGKTAPTNSSIDLKSFSITVDGEEVFSGSKTIYQALTTKADLGLNNSTVPHIVETYVNNTSWYRVYSDGWCEQGGHYTNSNNVETAVTINFLKTFINTNYDLQITRELGSSPKANAEYRFVSSYIQNSKTTTCFQTWMTTSNRLDGCDWRTCGYIK